MPMQMPNANARARYQRMDEVEERGLRKKDGKKKTFELRKKNGKRKKENGEKFTYWDDSPSLRESNRMDIAVAYRSRAVFRRCRIDTRSTESECCCCWYLCGANDEREREGHRGVCYTRFSFAGKKYMYLYLL